MTTIKSFDELFSREELDGELCKLVVDKMIFSEYPGAKLGGTVALSALFLNSNNFDELKNSGSLGAILELLRRINIEETPKTEQIENLVQCLHVLCLGEDEIVQERLLSNPHGVSTILRLCRFTFGNIQKLAVDMLISLSKLDRGIRELVRQNVIDTVMTEAMLYRNSTIVEVRHAAANLVHRIAVAMPEVFPVDKFVGLAVDVATGRRRIDAYQEIQFLHGLVAHWHYLTSNGRTLSKIFGLFPHLIDELKFELFDNLDHCALIVKCCVLGAKDPMHVDYLLKHELEVALQYLVRTDFTLFRRKVAASDSADGRGKSRGGGGVKKKHRRLNVQDSGDRSAATLSTLSMIRSRGREGGGGGDDVNFFVTKSTVQMYESILDCRIETVSEIVSSGLISALLFRVGPGADKDIRYMTMLVGFVYHLMLRVVFAQTDRGARMCVLGHWPKQTQYAPLNYTSCVARPATPAGPATPSASFPKHLRAKVAASTDLRAISCLLQAQGVVELLLLALSVPDNLTIVLQAVTALSCISFNVLRSDVCAPPHMDRILSLIPSRHECYFPVLSILCEIIAAEDPAHTAALTAIAVENKGMRILVGALKLSGWDFNMKAEIYTAVSKLSHLPLFRETLIECNGLSSVLSILQSRRRDAKGGRKSRDGEDDGSDNLFMVLRSDLAAARIQAAGRVRLARRRVRCIVAARLLGDHHDATAQRKKPGAKPK